MNKKENGGILPQDRADCVSPNIPVIQTHFEVADLTESGYSKVERKFIKTRDLMPSVA